MANRYFHNLLPDFDEDLPANSDRDASSSSVTKSVVSLLRQPTPRLSEQFLKAALSLKGEVVQATCSMSGKRQRDFSIYTGTLGTAFLCFRAYQTTGNIDDLNLCRAIVKECAGASGSMRQCPTFLLGASGIYALGAVAAKCGADNREVDHYVKLLCKVGGQSALALCSADARNDIPYELLYGRAGYVWAVLFMNKQLGYEAIPTSVLVFPADFSFEKAALEAGELVWKRGLLRKVGLCHGISGNAYTFLALHRVFGGNSHLHRAKSFGCFLLEHGSKLIASSEMHGGDHPYSLFEGLAGMACLWLDLVNPQNAKFPGYEV